MLLEIILILIMLVMAVAGYRKGIIMSMVSLLILMVCCLGAFVAQRQLTTSVEEWMEPKIETVIQEKLEQAFADSTENATETVEDIGITIGGTQVTVEDLVELLGRFGIDAETAVQDAATDAAKPLITQYAEQIAHAITEWTAGLLVFLIAFLMIYLVLHAVELVINLADHIPVVHTLNRVAGAMIGVISAVFLITMLTGAFARAGMLNRVTSSGPLFTLIRRLAEVIS